MTNGSVPLLHMNVYYTHSEHGSFKFSNELKCSIQCIWTIILWIHFFCLLLMTAEYKVRRVY